MTLDELIEQVYDITERPDLDKLTLNSIIEATMTLHNSQNWWKDIKTVLVNFDNPLQYIQILDTQLLPRFGSIAVLRKTSSQAGPVQQYGKPWPPQNVNWPTTNFNILKKVEIDDILDSYGYEKADVWYAAGSQINIKSSTALAQVLASYYQTPMIGRTNDRYSSWIADQYPYTIIYRAAGTVFAHTGDDKNSAMYMRPPTPGRDMDTGGLYWQQLDILQQAELVP